MSHSSQDLPGIKIRVTGISFWSKDLNVPAELSIVNPCLIVARLTIPFLISAQMLLLGYTHQKQKGKLLQILLTLVKHCDSLLLKQSVNAQHSSKGRTGISLDLLSAWICLLGIGMPAPLLASTITTPSAPQLLSSLHSPQDLSWQIKLSIFGHGINRLVKSCQFKTFPKP